MKKRVITFFISLLASIILYYLIQLEFSKVGVPAMAYIFAWFSFNTEKIAAYHQQIMDNAKFSYYIFAHLIDLCFVISYGICTWQLFNLFLPGNKGGKLYSLNKILRYSVLLTAIFDMCETLLILVSCVNPTDIPDYIAITHPVFNGLKYLFCYAFIFWFLIVTGNLIYQNTKKVQI